MAAEIISASKKCPKMEIRGNATMKNVFRISFPCIRLLFSLFILHNTAEILRITQSDHRSIRICLKSGHRQIKKQTFWDVLAGDKQDKNQLFKE